MLQVHKNETSLRKCSGGTANLGTLEGTLLADMQLNLPTTFWARISLGLSWENKGRSTDDWTTQ